MPNCKHNIIIQKQVILPSGAQFIILQEGQYTWELLNVYASNTNLAWKQFWKDILHALP